jgi:hypothetical protein
VVRLYGEGEKLRAARDSPAMREAVGFCVEDVVGQVGCGDDYLRGLKPLLESAPVVGLQVVYHYGHLLNELLEDEYALLLNGVEGIYNEMVTPTYGGELSGNPGCGDGAAGYSMLATPGRASGRERRLRLGLTHCDDFAEVLFYSLAVSCRIRLATICRASALQIIACMIRVPQQKLDGDLDALALADSPLFNRLGNDLASRPHHVRVGPTVCRPGRQLPDSYPHSQTD